MQNNMSKKSRTIYFVILIILFAISIACTDSDEQLLSDIQNELASEIEDEIDDMTSSLVEEAKNTANEKVTEIKDDITDEITNHFGNGKEINNKTDGSNVSPSHTRAQVLQKIKEEHGSLPLLPDYGDPPPSALNYQCVYWAKARRLTLNGEKLAISTIPSNGSGAKNYIQKYSISIVKITHVNNKPNCTAIQEGSVVVIDANSKGTGSAGHAAVIEVVQEDGIWISEQNWPYRNDSEGNAYYSGKRNHDEVRFLSWNEMIGLYIIPKDASPD
ncbi:MAG: hypothetical protein PWQ55_716 [Chloroflexota bacterium]|nr:hypothetical protein [Chloroflexota bacterium]